jgi:F-type H+-transporting ATPase subunit epsilon
MAQRPTLTVVVVAPSGTIYDGPADEVIAEGSEGQLGILPRHAPLMTTLKIGPLRMKHNDRVDVLFVAGGFLEVSNNRVIVLADDAERGADVDEARAEEARRRAQEDLAAATSDVDRAALTGALDVAIGRLKVAELQRTHHRHRDELP